MHTGIPRTPYLSVGYKGSTPEDNGTIGGLRPVKMLLFGLASPLLLLAFTGVFVFCLERHEGGLRAVVVLRGMKLAYEPLLVLAFARVFVFLLS